jgi:hypothetical protein
VTRLGTISDGENDSAGGVSAPPSSDALPEFAKLFDALIVGNSLLPRERKVGILHERDLLL